MNRDTQFNFWYVLFALMGIVLLRDLWVQAQEIEAIPYSQFETYLEQGVIDSVSIGSTRITGKFKMPQDGKTGFVTTPVAPGLAERLQPSGITYSGAVESTWFTTLLSWILPALIFVGIWMFLIRRMSAGSGIGGLTTIGKSRAKVLRRERHPGHFRRRRRRR